MSGDNLHASPRTTPSQTAESVPTVTPRLLQRVRDARRDATPEQIVSAIADDLFDGDLDDVVVSEAVATQSLDEILIALITLRDDETHGTGLMEDITALFDVEPSPGTVYPRLHGLEADGTLARHDLVQTKQYSIDDDDAAADQLERAMYQHLSVGLFLHAALDAV